MPSPSVDHPKGGVFARRDRRRPGEPNTVWGAAIEAFLRAVWLHPARYAPKSVETIGVEREFTVAEAASGRTTSAKRLTAMSKEDVQALFDELGITTIRPEFAGEASGEVVELVSKVLRPDQIDDYFREISVLQDALIAKCNLRLVDTGLPLTRPLGGFTVNDDPRYAEFENAHGTEKMQSLVMNSTQVHAGTFDTLQEALVFADLMSRYQHLFLYLSAATPFKGDVNDERFLLRGDDRIANRISAFQQVSTVREENRPGRLVAYVEQLIDKVIGSDRPDHLPSLEDLKTLLGRGFGSAALVRRVQQARGSAKPVGFGTTMKDDHQFTRVSLQKNNAGEWKWTVELRTPDPLPSTVANSAIVKLIVATAEHVRRVEMPRHRLIRPFSAAMRETQLDVAARGAPQGLLLHPDTGLATPLSAVFKDLFAKAAPHLGRTRGNGRQPDETLRVLRALADKPMAYVLRDEQERWLKIVNGNREAGDPEVSPRSLNYELLASVLALRDWDLRPETLGKVHSRAAEILDGFTHVLGPLHGENILEHPSGALLGPNRFC